MRCLCGTLVGGIIAASAGAEGHRRAGEDGEHGVCLYVRGLWRRCRRGKRVMRMIIQTIEEILETGVEPIRQGGAGWFWSCASLREIPLAVMVMIIDDGGMFNFAADAGRAYA